MLSFLNKQKNDLKEEQLEIFAFVVSWSYFALKILGLYEKLLVYLFDFR